MRATTMSLTAAALAAFTLIGGCNDFTGPPNEPTSGGLILVPGSATLNRGQVLQLKATMQDGLGDALAGVTIAWRSSNDAVATVAATGEVFGRREGQAVITASAMGKTQFSTIHVVASPQGTKLPKPSVDPGSKLDK